jgi:hypothetical protein
MNSSCTLHQLNIDIVRKAQDWYNYDLFGNRYQYQSQNGGNPFTKVWVESGHISPARNANSERVSFSFPMRWKAYQRMVFAAPAFVANLWTEFAARDWYEMGTNGKEFKNRRSPWWLQLSKRAKTYVFTETQIRDREVVVSSLSRTQG